MIGMGILKVVDGKSSTKTISQSNNSYSLSQNQNNSDSFDSCLKSYSKDSNNSNSENTNQESKNDNENINLNSNKNYTANSSNDSDGTIKLDSKAKDNKVAEDTKDDDIKTEASNDNSNEDDDENVDIKSLLSIILGCFNGGTIDMDKLKGELKNLKIPEDIQNDVFDFVSKIQDTLKGKDLTDCLKSFSLGQNYNSDTKEHDELINKIVDDLKAKVNQVETSDDSGINQVKNTTLQSEHPNSNEADIGKLLPQQDRLVKADNVNNSASDSGKDFYSSSQEDSYSTQNYRNNEMDSGTDSDSGATPDGSDKFLNDFLSQNKTDNQFSKVTAFMNQFSTPNANAEGLSKEVPSISQSTFTQDIIQSVKFMDVNNLKELTVKINPKELGEVVISLSMENNIMKANISTANKETYALLNSKLNDINNNLNNQNIKIQNVSVNIYDDTTYFSGRGNDQGNRQNNKQNEEDNDKNDENIAINNDLGSKSIETNSDSNINILV